MIPIKAAWSWKGGRGQVIANERSEAEKEDRMKSLYKRTSILWQQTYLPGSSHTPSENMKSKLTGKEFSPLMSHEQVLVFLAQGWGKSLQSEKDQVESKGHTHIFGSCQYPFE